MWASDQKLGLVLRVVAVYSTYLFLCALAHGDLTPNCHWLVDVGYSSSYKVE